MARKCFLVFCLVGVAALGLTTGDAQAQSDQERKQAQANQPVTITGPMTRAVEARPAAARPAPDGPGVTITYDDGIVTALPAINGYCFGNQFNTVSGGAVASHSITGLTFYIVTGAGTDAVFLSAYGPVAGTVAPFYDDTNVPLNVGSGAFNSFTFPAAFVGAGSFQAGVWYVAGDTVGLGSGTVASQGHHGMAINDISGTDFQTLGSLNALVSARTAVVPVELMQFSIEN